MGILFTPVASQAGKCGPKEHSHNKSLPTFFCQCMVGGQRSEVEPFKDDSSDPTGMASLPCSRRLHVCLRDQLCIVCVATVCSCTGFRACLVSWPGAAAFKTGDLLLVPRIIRFLSCSGALVGLAGPFSPQKNGHF